MMIDIFSATTCSVLFLDRKPMETQLDYIDFILDEEEIISNGCPIPRVLLQNIIHTTLLRVSQRNTTTHVEKPFVPPQEFAAILRSIDNFDALSWANRVALYGRTRPQKPTDCASAEFIVGWFALATCYKSAALLYLLLSCTSVCGESVMPKVLSAKRTLWMYTRLLLDISSLDHDGPVETQLWKFLRWPM